MADQVLSASWERAKVISGILATILIPLLIGVTGHLVSTALKERDIQLRYVELALGILREKPDPSTTELRSWAINIVNRFAPEPLSPKAVEELKKRELAIRAVEDALRVIEKVTRSPQ